MNVERSSFAGASLYLSVQRTKYHCDIFVTLFKIISEQSESFGARSIFGKYYQAPPMKTLTIAVAWL